MQSRREFLSQAFLLLVSVAAPTRLKALASSKTASSDVFVGADVFHKILSKAHTEKWETLPIGELMGKIARQFEGTPYVASTLELSSDAEICSANLQGLDCVTFFETTLDIARMLKQGGTTPNDLLKQIRLTRYRGGKLNDFASRLHYTTDWFVDNQRKGVVEVLAKLPGSKPFAQKVNLMSAHPENSRQLKAHPELVSKIKATETEINSRAMTYVPLEQIAAVEPLLKTGDIVGICTNLPGLDITHTGIVYRTEDGVAHFMDASSRKSVMKVVLEPGPISETLKKSKTSIGAMFARPLEPRK